MCTNGICNRVLIDNCSQYPWLTFWSVLDWHPNWFLGDTQSTLDKKSVDSQLSVHWLMCINLKICWLMTKRTMECSLSVNWGVTRGSIKGWSTVLQLMKGIYRLSTANPLIHMISVIFKLQNLFFLLFNLPDKLACVAGCKRGGKGCREGWERP